MQYPQGTLYRDLDHDLPEVPSLLELKEYKPLHTLAPPLSVQFLPAPQGLAHLEGFSCLC